MTGTPIKLRRLRLADAATAVEVMHRAFRAQPIQTDPPSGALRETEATVAAAIARGGAGAEAAGRLVGVVFWSETEGGLYFGRLAVCPAHRGRGIGRALVQAAERVARERGLGRVHLGTRLELEANRAFFAACGYREAGFETHAGYSAPTSVVMEKRLTRG